MPGAKRHVPTLDVLIAAYRRMDRHGGDGLAAGLAFGALVSAAPLLLVTLAVIARVLDDHDRARSLLDDSVGGALGPRAVELLGAGLDEVLAWSTTATWVGLVFFAFGATRLALLVDAAFEVIFELEDRARRVGRLPGVLGVHLDALAVTLVGGLLVTLALLIRAGSPLLTAWLRFAPPELAWLSAAANDLVQLVVGFLALFVAVAIAYARLPPVQLERTEVLEGALLTSVLLEAGLSLLHWLGEWLELGAAYGAASAFIATLLVLQWSAQVFIFGAEVTAERARQRSQSSPTRGP